jgi:L-rhamnose mutarotase
MKIHKAFVMLVNAGADTECHKRHNPIWPELEKVLKDHGVLNYSIFLHTETRQLFGYAEIESEEQWADHCLEGGVPKMVATHGRC